jgi:hypothetical protein
MIYAFRVLLLIALTSGSALVSANDYADAIAAHANSSVKSWLSDKTIVTAIKQQNQANASLAQDDIIRLDKQWRAEVGGASKPLVDTVMGNDLSAFLRKKMEESHGLYTEIFVMDNHGLNVGQSGITSDYWQGDEAKWQETYNKGAGSMHISDVEEDESTQTYQSQLSLPIVDPADQSVIGAITIGINVENL